MVDGVDLHRQAGFAFWNASTTLWMAAFGTASDWLEPSVTVPVAAPEEPPSRSARREQRGRREQGAGAEGAAEEVRLETP